MWLISCCWSFNQACPKVQSSGQRFFVFVLFGWLFVFCFGLFFVFVVVFVFCVCVWFFFFFFFLGGGGGYVSWFHSSFLSVFLCWGGERGRGGERL